jgi:hypothetical protein
VSQQQVDTTDTSLSLSLSLRACVCACVCVCGCLCRQAHLAGWQTLNIHAKRDAMYQQLSEENADSSVNQSIHPCIASHYALGSIIEKEGRLSTKMIASQPASQPASHRTHSLATIQCCCALPCRAAVCSAVLCSIVSVCTLISLCVCVRAQLLDALPTVKLNTIFAKRV